MKKKDRTGVTSGVLVVALLLGGCAASFEKRRYQAKVTLDSFQDSVVTLYKSDVLDREDVKRINEALRPARQTVKVLNGLDPQGDEWQDKLDTFSKALMRARRIMAEEADEG